LLFPLDCECSYQYSFLLAFRASLFIFALTSSGSTYEKALLGRRRVTVSPYLHSGLAAYRALFSRSNLSLFKRDYTLWVVELCPSPPPSKKHVTSFISHFPAPRPLFVIWDRWPHPRFREKTLLARELPTRTSVAFLKPLKNRTWPSCTIFLSLYPPMALVRRAVLNAGSLPLICYVSSQCGCTLPQSFALDGKRTLPRSSPSPPSATVIMKWTPTLFPSHRLLIPPLFLPAALSFGCVL